MPALALVLALAFALLSFGVRTITQIRRTGDSGWRVGSPTSAATALSHATLVLSPLVLLIGVVLAMADAGAALTWSPPAPGWMAAAGTALAVAGTALCFASQVEMGDSWRIGVDESERTSLVTGGLYRWVRNPIYTAILLFMAGEVLVLPSTWTAAAAVLVLVGVEAQTRLVEEPFLRTTHGAAYAAWASSVGRFLPGVGRAQPVGAEGQPA
jgi:protein-S-isoprenylcysteine O-methyltransferase Ste14